MKTSLLLSVTGITLVALTATTLYAQTVAGTSLVDKMKTAVGDFTLSTVLNPGQTGLKSAPVSGKKTGDILTAGEWNRVLELLGEGTSGGSGSSGSGWENVPLTDTNPFNQQCMYRVVMQGQTYYLETIHENRAYWIYNMYFEKTNKSALVGGIAPVNVATKMEKFCGGGVGGGSGWENVLLTDTADFDTACLYEVQLKTTDTTNNNLMNGDTTWRTGTIRGNKYLGLSFTDGSSATFSLWGIGSSNKNVYGYRDASGTFFPVNSVSVLSMRRLCGGGGGSSVNSDDYSRAKAIRASGFTLNIPSGITDWPDTIVCDGFGGWAGGRQILTLDFTGNNVVGYTQAEGVGVYFNPSTGVLAQADRVGSCGASNIATICAAGRCIK